VCVCVFCVCKPFVSSFLWKSVFELKWEVGPSLCVSVLGRHVHITISLFFFGGSGSQVSLSCGAHAQPLSKVCWPLAALPSTTPAAPRSKPPAGWPTRRTTADATLQVISIAEFYTAFPTSPRKRQEFLSASAQASSVEIPLASAMAAHTRRSSSAADVAVAGACLSVSIKILESGTTLRTSGSGGVERERRNSAKDLSRRWKKKFRHPCSGAQCPRERVGRGCNLGMCSGSTSQRQQRQRETPSPTRNVFVSFRRERAPLLSPTRRFVSRSPRMFTAAEKPK